MNSKLQDAVAIFRELGWEHVTPENVLELPTGSKEQRQAALDGLKSGEWGEFTRQSENSYGWQSHIDVDSGALALFAVRIGVNAQRAANILNNANPGLVTEVIASRGVKYAADFIGYACVSRRRGFEHSASAFGSIAVRLVDRLNLDIPQNAEYMKDWSVHAAAAMGLKAEIFYKEVNLPGLELIERRFVEHISVGVAAGAPATGPFGAVFPEGVKRGWLSGERGIELVFSALDASVRPGDRKVWLNVLDELGIADKELCARTQALIPLLSSGDAFVITRLAPVLIAGADDRYLMEVILSALSGATKKARQVVLKAALGRTRPKNAEELSPWLGVLAGDSDKSIASLATRLITQWGMDTESMPEKKPEIQGLWQETPPVWEIPSFDLGEVSPEALTELAAKLVQKSVFTHDVILERFLAVTSVLAYQDPEALRTSLRGLRPGLHPYLDHVIHWIKKEAPRYGFDTEKHGAQAPLEARDYIVALHLGKLPCLLSTPSLADLSISIPDLMARLETYKKLRINALEADLFLALTRLDVKTNTPQASRSLQAIDVPVVLQSGEKMPLTAGQAVLKYLADPIKESFLVVDKYGYWDIKKIGPDALGDFPKRLKNYQYELFAVFPLWGDAALHAVRWDSEVYHEQGLVLRQAARRATPLPPGASINFLAAQRSMTPDAAEDSMLAVTEAWERGLLRPGIADVSLLDWSTRPPSNLAALAAALEGIARDGMLSLVWPVLDALIEASLKAPRLLAGTAEIAELISVFLPEAQYAVKKGLVDDIALHLSGIRSLAQRGGSSRAVETARKIAAVLPPASGKAEEKANNTGSPIMDPPFEEVWPERKKGAAPIEDGVAITVDWLDVSASIRFFVFTLTLPDIKDRVFKVVKGGWFHDLDSEGQCDAYVAAPGVSDFERDRKKRVYLHWDVEQKAMLVCEHRNWREGTDGPLAGRTQAPPLSSSLLTVIIGLLAQDGSALYFAPRFVKQLFERGEIGEEIIRNATQTLLRSPAVSPAKLARALENDIKLLPALWPVLTECVKSAGALLTSGEAPPVWINRILDIALRYAPYLAEAAKHGFIPPEAANWPGLSDIASSKSKSVAVAKAKKLLAALA
ncbi:hypothetical protein FACS1894158_12350 [Betaproteobacteria bacterium]|nr:hypothetical protein FACS1894158_12350 [Betaproteobacteria bacterium]